ncbi:TPA: hypothetical protein WHY06_001980, partial [Neisseria meningitidis]
SDFCHTLPHVATAIFALYILHPIKGLHYFFSKDYYRIKSIFLSDRDYARAIFKHCPDVALPDRMLQTASEGFAVLEYEDDNVREIDGI